MALALAFTCHTRTSTHAARKEKKEKEERKRYRLWLRLASAAAAFPPFVYYSLRQPLLMGQGGRRRRQTATTLRSRTHSLGEWLTSPGHCCCCCCHSVTHTNRRTATHFALTDQCTHHTQHSEESSFPPFSLSLFCQTTQMS